MHVPECVVTHSNQNIHKLDMHVTVVERGGKNDKLQILPGKQKHQQYMVIKNALVRSTMLALNKALCKRTYTDDKTHALNAKISHDRNIHIHRHRDELRKVNTKKC